MIYYCLDYYDIINNLKMVESWTYLIHLHNALIY